MSTRGHHGLLLGAGKSYAATVMEDAPLGYWRLGEPSGTVVADSSGNSYTGTAISCTRGAASLVNNNGGDLAISGDGTSSQITVGAASALYNLNRNCTIEAWCKPIYSATGQSSGIWSAGLGGICIRANFDSAGVQIEWLKDYTVSYRAFGTNLPNNTRFHLMFAINSSGVRSLYINGALFDTASPGATFAGQYVRIGADGRDASTVGTFLHGTLDEVAVYGTALSAARAATHFAAGN